MKKVLSLVLSLVMILSCFACTTAFAQDDIKITINGQNLEMDQKPVMINDRTLVPVRAIFEALGAVVTWDDATETATGVKDGKEIKITIENTTAYVDGKAITLDVPAKLINDRTLVPVRFISESLGEKVDWDDATQTVIITSENQRKIIFDDLDKFVKDQDYVIGGDYKESNITLSSEFDHTTGTGKSFKLDNRTANSQRIKIIDSFSAADLGKTLTVSAWVYVPDVSTFISLSLYGDKGTDLAFNTSDYINVEVPANTWTKLEFEYNHKNSVITQIGIDQRKMDVPIAKTIYIDDVEVIDPDANKPVLDTKIRKYDFDNVTSFENNKDFIVGGDYKSENITISGDVDHTTGSGKAVKVDNREVSSQRVKLLDMFTSKDFGKVFTVSAWVYIPDVSTNVSLSIYGDKGTDFAFNPGAYKNFDIEKNTWTKIEMPYEHKMEILSQLSVDQRKMGVPVAKTMYIDDIEITEVATVSTEAKNYFGDEETERVLGIPVKTSSTGIVRPNITNTGKSYDDIIIYDREFENKTAQASGTPDEIFASLQGGEKVVDNEKLMEYTVSGEKFGTVEKIAVDGEDVIRASVDTVPESAYTYQLGLPEMVEGEDFVDGDTMLLVFKMRTINANNEMSIGKVQCVVEQNVDPYQKSLQEYVETTASTEWTTVYLPYKAKTGFPRLCIRLGYLKQTVEIGGYEMYNFGTKYEIDQMPSNKTSQTYDTVDLFDKDAQWRKDAIDRIEQIRKGDFKVVVKDANGNVIKDAKVDVNMTDHEFMWGSAVNSKVLAESDFGDNYRGAIESLYNTVVYENEHKWNIYASDKEKVDEMTKTIKDLGVKYIRGHALIWDRHAYDPKTGEYIENTTVPENIAKLTYGDKADLDKAMKANIDEIVTRYKDDVVVWDVVNELINNKTIRSKYGNQVLIDWYNWARSAAGEDTKLYINETGFHGTNNDQYNTFCGVLDYMTENNVDFDGIGIQGHFGAVVNPVDFYNQITALSSKYDKKVTITEYDAFDSEMTDTELEASFLRDIMILCFSQENVEGFLTWGFTNAAHWKQFAPIFNADWSLKLSGEQWIDLVYNKWWTVEEGNTDANGEFSTNGYYGDYDITVTANGKTKTVATQCYKANDNTITIVMD